MNEQARVLLITASILKFCACVFVVFGILMFTYIYVSVYQDDPARALKDPMFAVTILVPFLPAAVLAFAASKKEKQARALISAPKEADSQKKAA